MASDPRLSSFLSLLDSLSSPPVLDALQPALDLVRSIQPASSTAPPPSIPALDTEHYSTLLHPAPLPSTSQTPPLSGLAWLRLSLSPSLANEALAILQSPSSDADIAGSLLELWGYEGIEQVGEAVARRSELVAAAAAAEGAREINQPTTEPSYNSAPEPAGPRQLPPHLMEGKRGHTPQAQLTFKTAADIAAAKREKKAGRYGKGKEREEEEVDLDEWERIREESLAVGPGALVSGKHVRRRAFVVGKGANGFC